MNTNENIRNETPEDIIVLGIASVETQGGPLMNEVIGGFTASGLSHD
jgi:hypothetical protein